MKYIILSIMILCFIIGCSKSPVHAIEPSKPYAEYPSLILGTWTWRWYYIYDSVYGGTPYQNLIQHTGGTYTFTPTTFTTFTTDTSWVSNGSETSIQVDTSTQSVQYRIIGDTLITSDNAMELDTFLINIGPSTLQLSLMKHYSDHYIGTLQFAHR